MVLGRLKVCYSRCYTPLLTHYQEEEYLQQLLERRARERYIQKERNELQKQLKVRNHQNIQSTNDGRRLNSGSPTLRTDQTTNGAVILCRRTCSSVLVSAHCGSEFQTCTGGHRNDVACTLSALGPLSARMEITRLSDRTFPLAACIAVLSDTHRLIDK